MSLSELVRGWFINPILAAIEEMGETIMANEAARLEQVANELNNNLFPAISQLLQENSTLRARNAELEGEDVAESGATDQVVAGTQAISDLFAAPDVPDVPPVDEPPVEVVEVDENGNPV